VHGRDADEGVDHRRRAAVRGFELEADRRGKGAGVRKRIENLGIARPAALEADARKSEPRRADIRGGERSIDGGYRPFDRDCEVLGVAAPQPASRSTGSVLKKLTSTGTRTARPRDEAAAVQTGKLKLWCVVLADAELCA
jgi:hypothetical protein